MWPDAKIGPAPNVTAVYPETCDPADVIAAENWEAIRCWLYLDVAARGSYNTLAWSYLEEHALVPTIAEGDRELLASAKPDFLAMNYYATATVAAARNDGHDRAPRNGDQQVMRMRPRRSSVVTRSLRARESFCERPGKCDFGRADELECRVRDERLRE